MYLAVRKRLGWRQVRWNEKLSWCLRGFFELPDLALKAFHHNAAVMYPSFLLFALILHDLEVGSGILGQLPVLVSRVKMESRESRWSQDGVKTESRWNQDGVKTELNRIVLSREVPGR
jgi:hypothetical protein